jgi:hypothetical protein
MLVRPVEVLLQAFTLQGCSESSCTKRLVPKMLRVHDLSRILLQMRLPTSWC